MRTRFDEVASLERLRCVLCHDELREQMENSIFDAPPKREAPSFVETIAHTHNLLVEIICLIDDRQRVH